MIKEYRNTILTVVFILAAAAVIAAGLKMTAIPEIESKGHIHGSITNRN